MPHLALPLELGSEDHHAISQRRLGSRPHALIGLRKTRYKPNNEGPRLEVITRVSKCMALVHMDDVVPGEFQTHLLVESIDATQNSK